MRGGKKERVRKRTLLPDDESYRRLNRKISPRLRKTAIIHHALQAYWQCSNIETVINGPRILRDYHYKIALPLRLTLLYEVVAIATKR